MGSDGGGVEDGSDAGSAGDAEGGEGGFGGDFELHEQDVGGFNGEACGLDIGGGEGKVGPRKGVDEVGAVVEDDGDGDAGAGLGGAADSAGVNAFGGECGDDGVAEGVGADGGDDGDLGAEAGGGGGLVAAFASDEGGERSSDERFARECGPGCTDDEVHHERADDGDANHGGSLRWLALGVRGR